MQGPTAAKGGIRWLAAALVLLAVLAGAGARAAAPTLVFSDNFEAGSLSRWTAASGVAVQTATVYAGTYALRAATTGAPAYVRKTLTDPRPDLYFRTRFRIASKNGGTVGLLGFRTADNVPILTVNLSPDGTLGYVNHITATERASSTTVSLGAWHELQVHLRVGSPGSMAETWLDGTKIAALSRSEPLGTILIGQVMLGDLAAGRTFDVADDDVVVSIGFVQAPANTSAPLVTGTAVVGSIMTAWPGAWTGNPPPAFTYAWVRCTAAGLACKAIPGANKPTYALVGGDAGSTVAASVTGTSAAGSGLATSAPTTTIWQAPVAQTAPALSGTAVDGNTLTAGRGTWRAVPPPTFAYAWLRCVAAGTPCSPIAGATGAAYALTSADVGSTVRAVVTASNSAGTASAQSAQSALVSALPPVNTAPPTIAGRPQRGQTLDAQPGTWSGTSPLAFGYRWERCGAAGGTCVSIDGADTARYVPTADDVGAAVRVVVTVTNDVATAEAASGTAPISLFIPPPLPHGLQVMVDFKMLAGLLTTSSDVVKVLAHPSVHGVSLMVYWSDLQPVEGQPPDPSRIGWALDQLDQAARLAGREPLPVMVRLYPTKLPAWLVLKFNRSGLPPRGAKRINELGMPVLALPAPKGGAFSLDVPMPTDPVYQQHVRELTATVDQALRTYDPDATRVPYVHFIGPSMVSNTMRAIFYPEFPSTGQDAYGLGWTLAGHLEAFRQFAREFVTYPSFRMRNWVFNFGDGAVLTTSSQRTVTAILDVENPAGPDATVLRYESLSVSYQTTAQTFRANAAKTEAFPIAYVAGRRLHAWEAWTPIAGNVTYPSANLPRQTLLENSVYGPPTWDAANIQGTLWVDLWARDLVNPDPTLDAFLAQWSTALRALARG